MKETLLKVEDVHVHYGGVKALDGASVSLDEGEIVALMAPNGGTAMTEFIIMRRCSSGFWSE